MADVPIATIDECKQWARGKIDDDHDDVLDAMLLSASDTYEHLTGLRVLKGTRAELLNGDDADGKYREILYLPRSDRMVLSAGLTVTENGSALTIATGYTTTADVILVNASQPKKRAKLIRRPTAVATALATIPPTGRWAPGTQNILLGYSSGWDEQADPTEVPEDVTYAVCWLAWLLFTAPDRVGKLSGSKGRSSVTHRDELPAPLVQMIDLRTAL